MKAKSLYKVSWDGEDYRHVLADGPNDALDIFLSWYRGLEYKTGDPESIVILLVGELLQ